MPLSAPKRPAQAELQDTENGVRGHKASWAGPGGPKQVLGQAREA